MNNPKDSRKAMTLAGLRWFPGGFHSVENQSRFRVAFRVDFESQNGAKIEKNQCFLESSFEDAFRGSKFLLFEVPRTSKSLILLSKINDFRKLAPTQNYQKIDQIWIQKS